MRCLSPYSKAGRLCAAPVLGANEALSLPQFLLAGARQKVPGGASILGLMTWPRSGRHSAAGGTQLRARLVRERAAVSATEAVNTDLGRARLSTPTTLDRRRWLALYVLLPEPAYFEAG